MQESSLETPLELLVALLQQAVFGCQHRRVGDPAYEKVVIRSRTL